ncbi:hypothetical protein CRG98_037679 [Punica granatum]|uniref:ABC transporter domain-containing protein n=1 Tax=Punica granatum TaxID=22663 RepID=A0A2I0ID70_PUNGR|nr:hypothetical protein CRG98_037679 [Punica granatum]
MNRGISGGQKKRLTTGEMIVGPARVLFMDEVSNGLDSSTTFQIITCLQQLAHIMGSTILVTLLQPAPEIFGLFDEVILMAEGHIVYHGPRDSILNFFECCGFKCPPRKGIADFLQEVVSKKDQAQYWQCRDEPHAYVTVEQLAEKFKEFPVGKDLTAELMMPVNRSEFGKEALSFDIYSLKKWELFKACLAREWLLMKRNSFVHVFKSAQLVVVGVITMTIFIRTRMKIDLAHVDLYMGSLFYSLLRLMVIGIAELPMTVSRLGVFYKQRDFYFYPAWAYSIPAAILKIPFSMLDAFLWTALTYYVIGYSPEPQRFFCQFFLMFLVHQASILLFRVIAALVPNPSVATTYALFSLLVIYLFGGFVIPKRMVLPFEPITLTFENVHYFVDTPKKLRDQGFPEKRLQLLRDITGAFRPGVLTALMGASGAGKTTLMDVLSGRKTGGIIEGDIRVPIEIPYILIEAVLFVAITYPAVGFFWSFQKVFLYFYTMFCTLLYFNYFGMMIVSQTPTYQVASILASFWYTMLNLFSGYIMPGPNIPKWWVWCYWICPAAWSLRGLLTSQYGDISEEIIVDGELTTIGGYLKSYYGYKYDELGLISAILLAIPLLFAIIFAFCIAKLNFQKR